ncbi:MAG TPA: hypothetical protein VGT40_20645 [Methylomirabilota bacterium]|jgi:cell division septation protein DedD|nr:hypothetical protein [Methylomirabilota bacterium]
MKYRHVWPGFLLLSTLAVLLASLVLWGDVLLTPSPAGGISRVLQLRLASGLTQEPSESPARTTADQAADPHDPPPSVPAPGAAPIADATPRRDETTSLAAPVSSSSTSAPVGQARFALDLGSFALDEDAERAEAQLNQAGFSTVRFRQQAPARLYTVSIRRLGADRIVLEPSKPEGLIRAAATFGDGAGESVRVAQALPLHSAVKLAERLRSTGHEVQITAEAVKVGQIALRHGNFTSRQEAETVSREISSLGVPNEVVQVR